MRVVCYLDHDKGGWTRMLVCNEHPRLTKTVSAKTRGARPATIICVDGKEVDADYEAIAVALNLPAPEQKPRLFPLDITLPPKGTPA